MKALFHSFLLPCIMFFGSCSSTTTDEQYEIEGNRSHNVEGQEEVLDEPEDVVAEGQEILKQIEGEYFELSAEGDDRFYNEPCGYSMHSVSVFEVYEGTGIWEIYWAGDDYYIESATKIDGDIHIKTNSMVEEEFWFMSDPKEIVWNFGAGRSESPEIVLREDIKYFEIRPCTDVSEILNHLSTSWYELTMVDGKEVIEVPCEAAPAGFDLISNGKFIDFREGSDPNEIIGMSKSNGRISIFHRSVYGGEPDTLVIHDLYSGVARIGNGSPDDKRYVSESSKGTYHNAEEPCE